MRLRNSIDFGFFIGAVALVLVGLLSFLSSRRVRSEASWVNHTYEVLRVLERAESDIRLPEHDPFITQRITGELSQLRALTADNDVQQRRLDTLWAIASGPRGPALELVQRMKNEEARLLRSRDESTNASATRS